ncbi:MAG: hypothetical protein R3F19_29355 [Verrucomicrobiales bacterium]
MKIIRFTTFTATKVPGAAPMGNSPGDFCSHRFLSYLDKFRRKRNSCPCCGEATLDVRKVILSDFAQVSESEDVAVGLRADGSVVGWGGGFGARAAQVPPELRNVTSIAVGGNNVIALRADGTIFEWGEDGLLAPSGLDGVTAADIGMLHGLALLADRTVVSWAEVSLAGLGTALRRGSADLTDVVAIAAGDSHDLALKSDGTVVAWGRGADGFPRVRLPVPEGLSGVTAIAAGRDHSLALRADGAVVAWGDNSFGQTDVPAGLSDIVSVDAGNRLSGALRSDGTLFVWGKASADILPVPQSDVASFTMNKELPVVRAVKRDGTVKRFGKSIWGDEPEALRGIESVSYGSGMIAKKTDGSLVGWSRAVEIGTGITEVPDGLKDVRGLHTATRMYLARTGDDRLAVWGTYPYVSLNANVPTSDELQDIRVVGAGDPYAIAIRHDGTWVGIGSDQGGKLQPPDDLDLSRVAALDVVRSCAVALMDDGTVNAWGSSERTKIPEDLSGVTAIACGTSHTLALMENGEVVSWNADGLMTVPEKVRGITAIAAGREMSVALDRSGEVFVWSSDGARDVPTDLGRATGIDAAGSGIVALVPLRSSGAAAFDQWRKSHFGTFDPVGEAADGEDVDFDGLNNAMEFATGGDPLRFDPLPVSIAVQDGGARVTYRRNPLASGFLKFSLEISDSLDAATWKPVPTSSTDWVTARDKFDEVTVTLSTGAESPRFVRLRTTRL